MKRIIFYCLFLLLGFYLVVSAATSQTIKFRSLYVALGDPDFSPATASSGLIVTYSSSNLAVATIVGNNIHIVGLGTTNITASQAGDGTYSAATPVVKVLTVGLGLPDMLAVELPVADQTTILAESGAMNTLLSTPHATGLEVTHDRGGYSFPLGGTMVTWTAWAGVANASAMLRQETGLVWVFRYGQTPLGVSGPVNDDSPSDAGSIENHYSRALGGNNGSNIVRDVYGNIHLAWFDGEVGRPYHLWYRRGVQNSTTGETTWTAPVDVADGLAEYKSFVSLAVTANVLHFTWATSGVFNTISKSDYVMYRRLVNTNGVWAFEAIQNTGLRGVSHDNGTDIAAFNDDEIHIVARNRDSAVQFDYGYRLAGSSLWTKEVVDVTVSCGGAIGYKYPAITVDQRGDVHIALTAIMRNGGSWPQVSPTLAGNSYYWNAWYMHRPRPTVAVPGTWTESHNALASFAEWQDQEASGQPVRDVAADWIDLQTDQDGNVYMAWHGTAVNLWVGKDDAFVTRRTFAFDGIANGWEQPQALYQASFSPNNLGYSWAPSICADKNGIAFPVFFYKELGVGTYFNYTDMESSYRVMRNGVFVDGGNKPLSNFATYNMTTSFADTSPHLYRHANGRAWLDVFQGMLPTNLNALSYNNNGSLPYTHEEVNGQWRLSYVVYQREEVTSYLAPFITTSPANISVNSGSTALFSVAVSGANPMTYQWNLNGSPILNATSSSYTTPVATSGNNGDLYSVTVTNVSGTVLSSNALLTVQASGSDVIAPSVPTGLNSALITASSVSLSWTASSDAVGVTGYKIFQNGVLIGTSTTISFDVTGLSAASTYSFSVSANDVAGNDSAQSSLLSVTTIAAVDVIAPSAPSGLLASSITQTSFSLSWVASTDAVGVSGYKIFQNGIQIGTSINNSFAVSGLTVTTTYSYTVSAYDAAGNSSAVSNVLSVSTIASVDTTAPSKPTGLIASSITQTTFSVSWVSSSDAVGVTGYKIYQNGSLLGISTATSYEVNNLLVSSTYTIKILAYDVAGNESVFSDQLSVSTLDFVDAIAPSVPTGLIASSVSKTSFSLTWTASTDAFGVVGYEVYKDGILFGTSTTTTLAITGLSSAKIYSMNILSYDAAGNKSAQSSALSVTTLVSSDTIPPNIPTNLIAPLVTDTGVTLSWTASTDDEGVVTYSVFQNGVEIAKVTETNYSVTDLASSTTYTYTVAANDAAGNNSNLSGAVTVTTASATNSSNDSNSGGGGGGGCSYSSQMPINHQMGNILIMVIFSLLVLFRRRKLI